LRARRDAELHEDLAKVVVDRAWTEEELRCDLAVSRAARDETRDLQLLRREVAQRARIALARGLSRRAELVARALLPRRRSELLEPRHRSAQVVARFAPLAVAAEELAEQQLGTRVFERTQGRREQIERLVQTRFRVIALGDERPTARKEPERPRLVPVPRPQLVLRKGVLQTVGPSCANCGLEVVGDHVARERRVRDPAVASEAELEHPCRLVEAAVRELEQAKRPTGERLEQARPAFLRSVHCFTRVCPALLFAPLRTCEERED